MAIPLTALYFLGGVALLATLGVFVNFGDEDTRIVVSFVASVLWVLFAVSSFDVRTVTTFYATKSESILPFAYVGGAFAVATFLLTLYMVMQAVNGEVGEADLDGMLR